MPPYAPADRARLLSLITDTIAERLAQGHSLELICARPDWPSRPTLRQWARRHPPLAAAIAAGQAIRPWRLRFPFDPLQAERLLHRIRLGIPLAQVLREPGLPHRRALNAWKAANPAFAADLAAAKAFAEPERRRYGRRRARMKYDEATADRLMLAVLRGATLPQLGRDPSFPSPLGLKRWRRADPEFDSALTIALKVAHLARGRARADRHCTPEITERIELAIVEGASLHSLSRRPDMPGLTVLYQWARTRPAFAAALADATEFRAWATFDPTRRRRQGT